MVLFDCFASFLLLAPGSLVDGDGTIVNVEADVALFGFVGLGSGFEFGGGGGAFGFGGGGVDWGVVQDWEFVVCG